MLIAPPLAAGTMGSRSSSSARKPAGSGVFLMRQARLAYLRVLLVSSKLVSLLDTQAMSTVRLLPPRESCSRRVSLESLVGGGGGGEGGCGRVRREVSK
jgi:hypothetical protein